MLIEITKQGNAGWKPNSANIASYNITGSSEAKKTKSNKAKMKKLFSY